MATRFSSVSKRGSGNADRGSRRGCAKRGPYYRRAQRRAKGHPDPVVIPQGRVTATILLPVGAEPGEYEIRLLDQDLALRASSTGSASIRDFVTTLETTIDLSSIAPGRYQLGLRRSGGEWQMFPARLQ
jgi:hypothetical protein